MLRPRGQRTVDDDECDDALWVPIQDTNNSPFDHSSASKSSSTLRFTNGSVVTDLIVMAGGGYTTSTDVQ